MYVKPYTCLNMHKYISYITYSTCCITIDLRRSEIG